MRGRIAMLKKSFFVLIISIAVAILGIFLLRIHYPIGPVVLLLSLFPIAGLIISKRKGSFPGMLKNRTLFLA